MPKLKIVIVEDDDAIRQFLKDVVEQQLGHEVVGEAATGTNMVRVTLEREPDVVIFDIHLPHLNGLDALHQIYQHKVVAAVAITGDRDAALIRRAQEEHVLAYLVKPVEAHQLSPALHIAWARFGELQELSTENQSLRKSLHDRKIVERAKGLIMKTNRCSEDVAFRKLQRMAMDNRVPIVEIAQSILEGADVNVRRG
jgi:response regulator NasT